MPCFLSLESCDTQALDLLSVSSAIVLTLRRRVRFYNKTSSSRKDVAWNETVEDMGTASWWPSADVPSTPSTRHLEGEIRLPKDLRPTSEMGHFSISVSYFDFLSSAVTHALVPVLCRPRSIYCRRIHLRLSCFTFRARRNRYFPRKRSPYKRLLPSCL